MYFVRANALLFAHEHLEAPYFKARDFAKGGIKSGERKKTLHRSKKAFSLPLVPKEGSRERDISAVSLRNVRAGGSGYVKPERG